MHKYKYHNFILIFMQCFVPHTIHGCRENKSKTYSEKQAEAEAVCLGIHTRTYILIQAKKKN